MFIHVLCQLLSDMSHSELITALLHLSAFQSPLIITIKHMLCLEDRDVFIGHYFGLSTMRRNLTDLKPTPFTFIINFSPQSSSFLFFLFNLLPSDMWASLTTSPLYAEPSKHHKMIMVLFLLLLKL